MNLEKAMDSGLQCGMGAFDLIFYLLNLFYSFMSSGKIYEKLAYPRNSRSPEILRTLPPTGVEPVFLL